MNDAHARRLIGFYRSCYLADSRDLDLDNLTRLPAQRWAWLDGREELASGGMPLLPLSAELGRALAEAQTLYQRELQLVYGVLPVCGRVQLETGASQAICGPLFYYEASLQPTTDGQSQLLAIDPQQVHGNWRLLRRLFDEDGADGLDTLPLPSGPLDAAALGQLLAWIQRNTRIDEVADAAGFPLLVDAEAMATALRRQVCPCRREPASRWCHAAAAAVVLPTNCNCCWRLSNCRRPCCNCWARRRPLRWPARPLPRSACRRSSVRPSAGRWKMPHAIR